MTRNLKVLGIALCAAFAMSAVAAGSASAHVFNNGAADGVAHLTAKAETPQDFTAVTGQDPHVICHAVNVHGTTENGDENVTVEPEYTECEVVENEEKLANATIDTEGCHYNFSGETTTGNLTENGEHANVELLNGATEGKPTCEAVKVTVSAFQVDCIDVNLQTIEHAVRYNNIEEVVEGQTVMAVTVEATAHEIESTTHNNGLICPTKTGGDETHTDGGYTGNAIVTAYKDAAHTEPVDLTLE